MHQVHTFSDTYSKMFNFILRMSNSALKANRVMHDEISVCHVSSGGFLLRAGATKFILNLVNSQNGGAKGFMNVVKYLLGRCFAD